MTLDDPANDFNSAAGTAAGAITIRDVDDLDLAGVNAGVNQLALTTGGALTDSAGNTAGALVLNAGAAVVLNEAGNDFDSVAGTAAGNVTVFDADDLDLAGVNVGINGLGLLTGGALTDSAANTAALLVFIAGGAVTLDHAGNDFDSVLGSAGGNVAITDIDDLDLAGVNVGANGLSLTTGGELTDSAGNTAGALVFDAGGAVTLDHPANDFDSAAGTAGGNVTLVDVDGLDLAGVDAGANQLSVKTGGLLTDSAGNTAAALVLDVVAGANLDDAGNDFDTLAGIGGNIHVTDADELDLAGVNVAANQLSLTTGGELTDSAASIAKALVFNAGGAVTLDEAANDFDAAAGIAAGDVTLVDIDDLDLAGVDAGVNELNVKTGGALTDSAGNTAGALVFDAGGAVTLDHAANDFDSAAGTAAGAITIRDVDDLDLAGIQAPAQTLDVKTGGDLTDSAASDVAALVFASGGNVTLDDPGNTFNTIAGRSGGNVLIIQNGDLVVGTVKGVDGVATTAGSNGDIGIETAGLLTVAKPVSADGSGDVVLRSGADRDLVINAQVDSGSGDISLIADDDVIVTANVKTGGGGDIAVWADADDDPDASGDDDPGGDVLHTAGTIETGSGDVYFYGEDIFQNPGAIHRTASGTLVYRADQTLNLNGVVNAGGGSIVAEAASIALNTLTAGNTIVLRASAGSIGGGTISARNVGLSAHENIGSSGNRAVVTASTLATDTDAGNNGDVYLTINGSAAAGTVTPPSVDPPAGEASGIPLPEVPTLTAIRSDDFLSMNGPGNVGGSEVSSGGDAVISLGSMQGLNSLIVGNDLDLTAGAVDITTIDVSGSADLSVAGLVFDTFTVGGEAQIEASGVDGVGLTVGGNLNLDASGDVAISEIDVGGDAELNTGDLSFDVLTADSVEADTGSIDMGRLTAGTAAIRAGGNVTDNGSLINVSTLTLVASGNIGAAGAHIDVNVPNLTQISGNNVYVTQLHAGDTRLGLVSAQGYLELFVPNATVGDARGGLVDANGDALNLAAGNGAFLNVRGYIGQPDDPLEANISGILRVDSYDLTGDETGASFIYVIYTQDAKVSGVKYIGDGAIPGLIIVNGQVLGGDENLMRRIFRTEAFTVETPELKSRQGIFGNPFFIHEYMDISEFSALGLIDFLLAGQATISGDPELPDEVYSEMIFGGVHPSTAVNFSRPADADVTSPAPTTDEGPQKP